MHLKTLFLAAAVGLMAMMVGPASALTILIDKDTISAPVPPKPAVYGTASTGSIGTHPGNGGVGSPLCDPMPTAYDAYYSLCQQRLFPVSLSERSTGSVKVLVSGAVPGVPAQCAYEYKHITGPWWNPSVSYSTTYGDC